MSRLVRTIVLKLHNPSTRKKNIIEEAMQNYSTAYQYLLDKAYPHMEEIAKGYEGSGKRPRFVEKWVDKDIDKELNQFSIEPFKDSLKMDFAAAIAGYLSLRKKDKNTKYPCANKLRPIFFCRYSIKRNYSLLFDAESQKYYAKLYLMNGRNAKRVPLCKQENRKIFFIDENRIPFEQNERKKSYELFPLAFGRYQEEFLKQIMNNPETIKTARLLKKNNEYFLSINIVNEKINTLSAENYMGISRGIDSAVNYSIVDKFGTVISYGFVKHEVEKHEIEKLSEDKLHRIANRLINVACENKCQIIVEKLLNRGDGLTWMDKEGKAYAPYLNCKSYNRLIDMINYKALSKDLPKVIKVSGFGIFNTCPYCGINSKSNRFSSSLLICTSCGRSICIEAAGALNIARKPIKYKKDLVKIYVEKTSSGIKFVNEVLEFEFQPDNPYDCLDEFMNKVKETVNVFYNNMENESNKDNFKKKYSLIKKIENNNRIFDFVNVI